MAYVVNSSEPCILPVPPIVNMEPPDLFLFIDSADVKLTQHAEDRGNPFKRQSMLRVSLSEKATYVNQEGQPVRKRTIVGSTFQLPKKGPSVPFLGRLKMAVFKKSKVPTAVEEDYDEDGLSPLTDKRRTLSDPNLLQISNSTGLFEKALNQDDKSKADDAKKNGKGKKKKKLKKGWKQTNWRSRSSDDSTASDGESSEETKKTVDKVPSSPEDESKNLEIAHLYAVVNKPKGNKPKAVPPPRPPNPPPIKPKNIPPSVPAPPTKEPDVDPITVPETEEINYYENIVAEANDENDSEDDIPLGDPDDFDDDFSEESCTYDEIEGVKKSEAEVEPVKFKLAPINLPIIVDEEEKEFDNEAHKVAHELMVTEQKYVNRLYLLDQVFFFKIDIENRAHNWFPPDNVKDMFSNVKSIFKLHKDSLLPKLEERLKEWSSNPRLGDLMTTFAPYFQMYTSYVKEFERAMELLNSLMVKVPDFAELVRTIQKDKTCGNLSLPHHMLEPVQRVPRYQLLLGEYLKSLPEDSDDIKATEDALEKISKATMKSNNEMKKLEKFNRLMVIQSAIIGAKNLIEANRELLKDGKIIKLSARRGESQERYLYLFNDILLCCSIHNKLMTTAKHKVRARLDLSGMVVKDIADAERTFCISARQKVVEFQDACDIGKRAPSWVRDDETTQCMRCAAEFHPIKKRRHHCRACGLVVCNKCSTYRVKLKYDGNRLNRVCKHCYDILQSIQMMAEKDETDVDTLQRYQSQDIQSDDGLDDVDFKGRLFHCSTNVLGKKYWYKKWFVIEDMALHFYKAPQVNTSSGKSPSDITSSYPRSNRQNVNITNVYINLSS
uniref:FYVE, RhoGEF and PH domain-containing protein 4-like n=1 Tax=Saccoglossus kowalevskii TaxID=10224 RepID=A0ABM0LU58_SACKO|nr:PREDICTED: FYVE, RhoGEF and PH domain-containing protein 4-like [Saccoglossus kowalevskii]